MKKKKAIKVIVIILILTLFGMIMFTCVFPKIYLSHKYDTKMSDYKVVEFNPGHYAYDIDYWGIAWQDMLLIYEYEPNGRQFEVDFFDFQYYDAYQMEDVEKWMIEELQENIDENIDCINISSNTVFGIYDKEKDKYKNVVWSKSDAYYMIQHQKYSEIFIKAKNFEDYLINKNVKEITSYYNYGNTNLNFDKYIELLNKRFLGYYSIENVEIAVHKYDLPIHKGASMYGVYLSSLTDEDESYIIMSN